MWHVEFKKRQRQCHTVEFKKGAFHLVRTHLGGGGGGSSLLYILIAYYMQKGEGVQIACKIAHIQNGRPQMKMSPCKKWASPMSLFFLNPTLRRLSLSTKKVYSTLFALTSKGQWPYK